MPDYRAMLEALDVKAGRVTTVQDWRRVAAKAEHTPGTLSDDDLAIIGFFGGEKSAEDARVRRTQAITRPTATPPKPAPATVVTSQELRKAFDDFSTETADAIVQVLKQVKDGLRAEIDALRTRNAELENRLVQLEATEAVRREEVPTCTLGPDAGASLP